MKIFGSRERIALQAELLEPAGQSVVGHICIWANGMRIGNYEEAVLLSPIADFLRGTIRRRNRQIEAELESLPPERILEAVKNEIFRETGGKPKSEDTSRRPGKRYRELCICPNGCEAFDGELAVLIDRNQGESFIWQDFADKNIRELRLVPGEYGDVVRSFLGWVDALTGHDPSNEHFAGKRFVIAGKLSAPQWKIAKLIRRLGGGVDQAVRQDTTYLLAGEFVGEPLQIVQARALGVPILSEAEFEHLLPSRTDESKRS